MSTFESFFLAATKEPEGPFPYQIRFATEPTLPGLITAPTGAGKTATIDLTAECAVRACEELDLACEAVGREAADER